MNRQSEILYQSLSILKCGQLRYVVKNLTFRCNSLGRKSVKCKHTVQASPFWINKNTRFLEIEVYLQWNVCTVATISPFRQTFYVSGSFAVSWVTFWMVSRCVLRSWQFWPISEAEFLAFAFSVKFQCVIERVLLSTFDGRIQLRINRMKIFAVR